MKKVIAFLSAVLVVLVALAGCGGSPGSGKASLPVVSDSASAGPGPGSPDLKATAGKVLQLTESQQWDALYDYLYIDIQKSFPRDQYVNSRKEEASHLKIKYRNYKVGEPRMLARWEDKTTGRIYSNVAEVPYTVDVVTPRGEMKVNNVIHLIQTPEKNWRYLWVDNR